MRYQIWPVTARIFMIHKNLSKKYKKRLNLFMIKNIGKNKIEKVENGYFFIISNTNDYNLMNMYGFIPDDSIEYTDQYQPFDSSNFKAIIEYFKSKMI